MDNLMLVVLIVVLAFFLFGYSCECSVKENFVLQRQSNLVTVHNVDFKLPNKNKALEQFEKDKKVAKNIRQFMYYLLTQEDLFKNLGTTSAEIRGMIEEDIELNDLLNLLEVSYLNTKYNFERSQITEAKAIGKSARDVFNKIFVIKNESGEIIYNFINANLMLVFGDSDRFFRKQYPNFESNFTKYVNTVFDVKKDNIFVNLN
jgi:hypothetical protein